MTIITLLKYSRCKMYAQKMFRNLKFAVKCIIIACMKYGSLVMGRLDYPQWLTVVMANDFIIQRVSSDNSMSMSLRQPIHNDLKETFTSSSSYG